MSVAFSRLSSISCSDQSLACGVERILDLGGGVSRGSGRGSLSEALRLAATAVRGGGF